MKKSNFLMIPFIIICVLGIMGCNEKSNDFAPIDTKKSLAINNLQQTDSTVYSLEEAMKVHNLNGLSVAVIEDYKVVWTGTWGVKDVLSNEPINEQTSFSTASISKALTATLMVVLEEKGMIDLDIPVSNYLKRWQLPESEYLNGTDITLAHLLSHTSGTTQHGFSDFYSGDTIPTLRQSLLGELPRYDKEIEIMWEPGTHWSYSGGGYVIAQMALEDHLGKSLAALAKEYIFNPLGMYRTTMIQPNEKEFLTNVAKAHDEDGVIIKTGIPITPQVAPSGMWSNPTDMAIFLIEMQNALRNKENKVISNTAALKLTTIVTSKVLGGWSLGWERKDGFGNYEWFGHGGANTGTGGHILGTMENGYGIAFFGNGANKNRFPVLNQFKQSIIKSHGWYKPLDLSKQVKVPVAYGNSLVGKYVDMFSYEIKVQFKNGKIYAGRLNGKDENELVYIGNSAFLFDGKVNTLIFKPNEDGKLCLYYHRNGTDEIEPAYTKIE